MNDKDIIDRLFVLLEDEDSWKLVSARTGNIGICHKEKTVALYPEGDFDNFVTVICSSNSVDIVNEQLWERVNLLYLTMDKAEQKVKREANLTAILKELE